jgi:hypothetical protein
MFRSWSDCVHDFFRFARVLACLGLVRVYWAVVSGSHAMRTIVITGATSGIGLETARILTRKVTP